MQSAPPDPDGLDSSWDGESGPEESESTRMIDSKELFERAGFELDEPPPPVEEAPRGRKGRITRRAPTEEINEQLHRARPSGEMQSPAAPPVEPIPSRPPVGETYEDTLDALLKESSMALECDEPGVASVPAFGAAPRSSDPGILPEDEELIGGLVMPPTLPGPRRLGRIEPPQIDLELGFEVPDLALARSSDTPAPPTPPPSSLPPATPPPGTLRLGIIDDDFEAAGGREDRIGPPPSTWPRGMIPPRPEPSRPAASSARPATPSTAHAPTLIPGARPLTRAPAAPPPAAPVPNLTPAPLPDDRRRQMLQRFEAGDYSGALVLAEAILDESPDDGSARRYAESCSEMLRQMYRARIGDGSRVLRIVISNEELRSLHLDHRAGFLLSCIDGMSSIDDILDVSGMRELDALRILFELVQESIIAPGD